MIRGASLVVTTHDLEKAAAHADRLIVLQRGRTVLDGRPAAGVLADTHGIPLYEEDVMRLAAAAGGVSMEDGNVREVFQRSLDEVLLAFNDYEAKLMQERTGKSPERLAREVAAGRIDAESVDETTLARFLDTYVLPDPDLVIRTSGEARISNFLLWQCSYAELYFSDTLFPDFRIPALYEAFQAYVKRRRTFGALAEDNAP